MQPTNPTAEALSLCVAAKLPVLLWGNPGSGKTSMVQAMVDHIRSSTGRTVDDYAFETVIASLHEPSDFNGLPVVQGDVTRFVPPEWALRVAKAGDGIVFFDELTTAPASTQAALLRVVFERVVGSIHLDNVTFIAAANPIETSAGGWELSAPLANRFIHLDWTPKVDDVISGFTSGFEPPALPDLPETFEQTPLAIGLVTGFLAAQPRHLLAPPTNPADASRGWPSPRSWDMTIRMLSAVETVNASDNVRNQILIGTVGEGVATELITYIGEADLPNPEDLLKDPSSFVLPPRGDQRYVVFYAVAAAAAGNPTPERCYAAWEILGMGVQQDKSVVDIAAMAAQTLAKVNPDNMRAHPAIREFIPILKKSGLWSGMIDT